MCLKKINFGIIPDLVQSCSGRSFVELAQVVLYQGLQIGPGVACSSSSSLGRFERVLGRIPQGIGPLQAFHSRQSGLVESSHGSLKLRFRGRLLGRKFLQRNVLGDRQRNVFFRVFLGGSCALQERVCGLFWGVLGCQTYFLLLGRLRRRQSRSSSACFSFYVPDGSFLRPRGSKKVNLSRVYRQHRDLKIS